MDNFTLAIITSIATIISALTSIVVVALQINDKRKFKEDNPNATYPYHKSKSVLTFRHKIFGYILAFFAAILFGIHHVLAKDLISQFGSLYTISIRNVAAGIILILFSSILIRQNAEHMPFFSKKTAAIIVGSTGANITYGLALFILSATAASALYKLNTIYVFAIVFLINPVVYKSIKWYNALTASIIVAFGAILALQGDLSILPNTDNSSTTGIFLMILAGVMWAIQNVFMEKGDYVKGLNFVKISYLGKILLIASAFIFTLAVIVEKPPELSSTFAFKMLLLGLVYAGAFITTYESINLIGALPTTALTSLEVFFTALLTTLATNTGLTFLVIMGSILIVLGNTLLSEQNSILREITKRRKDNFRL